MLTAPDLPDARLISRLRESYALPIDRVEFLPLGADRHTAVYRADSADGTAYFLKLRRGAFDETSVTLPGYLAGRGVPGIIAPLPTASGRLWASLPPFRVIAYPYVDGRDAYEVDLTDRQWADLGRALRGVHDTRLPPALEARIPREAFSPEWRSAARGYLARAEGLTHGADPVTAELVAFLARERDRISDLIDRAEGLARALRRRAPAAVVCHGDVHAGNVLVARDGALYIVDWDAPILAPRERDLMYAGAGLMGGGRAPEEEEALFYRGYGDVRVDPAALAYYRYERIVQDVAEFCRGILLGQESRENREQSLRWLAGSFAPGGVVEAAYRSDATAGRA